ncbi:hypothetical protein [Micromonospora endophytica]|uniref:hypothetical protein n=1 Tax=Micromonospora endophytica TaxID=515350 RepID=UPI001BB35619|nr:hypothetical protein [Micromonospora endophytica]
MTRRMSGRALLAVLVALPTLAAVSAAPANAADTPGPLSSATNWSSVRSSWRGWVTATASR